jgi:hypothetical protein
MSEAATLQQHLGRLIEIEIAARPPPTKEQRAAADRVMVEIDELRTLTASTKARDLE